MTRLAALAVVLLVAPLARAADPPDPLRLIPASAAFVLKVEHPRRLAEAVVGLSAVKDAQQLAPVREVLDGAAARRFYQVLAHLERELGADWPELLDRLAAGGLAVGGGFGDNAAAVLVTQGTDPAAVGKAFDVLVKVLDDELARLGAPVKAARGKQNGFDTARVGDEFHAARAGAALIVSNNAGALAEALKLAKAGAAGGLAAKESVKAARKLLPPDPLAWLWVDFAAVKQDKATKDFLEDSKKDFLGNLVIGGTIDSLRRSDFVAAGLYRDASSFRLAVRLPAGKSDAPVFALHTPPAGKPGSLPLLEPPGVLYSQSFYLDIGRAWTDRKSLFNDDIIGQIEEGEKQISKVLPGPVKLGEIMAAWGPYHRLVAFAQETPPYKTAPGQALPAFGYVTTVRDPQAVKSLESALRGGGLVAGLTFGVKLSEREVDGVKVVAYRFPENKPLDGDDENVRFNFEPCFAVVGDQFIGASTTEAMKKLIAEVRRTAKLDGSPLVWRNKLYAAAGGEALYATPDPFVTEFVLRYGSTQAEARKQVDALTAWAKTLGTVRVEIDEAAAYTFDVIWDIK